MSRLCYLYLCIIDCSLYKPLTQPQVTQTQKVHDYSTFSENLRMHVASTYTGRKHSLCLGIGNSHTAREEEIVTFSSLGVVCLAVFPPCFCFLFGFCLFAPLCAGRCVFLFNTNGMFLKGYPANENT